MKGLKKAAERLCDDATAKGVQFPSRWRRPMIVRTCCATLMENSTSDSFNEAAALAYMIKKYGTGEGPLTPPEEVPVKKQKVKSSQAPHSKAVNSKRRNDTKDESNENTSDEFEPKKFEMVTIEENRPLVEAVKAMGDTYFQLNDPQKGVAYMTAVKSIRQSDHEIVDEKSALALRAVGTHIGKYIGEFLKTGDVKHWEKLRATLPKKS